MQKTQNTEIQQRVINLVELYRTKVGKESQIAKDAKAEKEYWDNENINLAIQLHEDGIGGPFGFDLSPETPEEWIKHLMVNEQLLGHFYSEVAGESAEKDILDQLLPDVYDKSVFTEEEESFLKTHFREMVNYIILTPCDDLDNVHRHDGKDAFTIPGEVLELIKSRIEIAVGSKVYYPNTAFAQLTNLFDGCTFYCDTMFYAWTRIALYANGISAEEIEKDKIPSTLDAVVSYLSQISEDGKIVFQICEAYKSLTSGGKMVLLCPSELLWKKYPLTNEDLPQDELRKQLVQDRAIVEIIQLPAVMSPNLDCHDWCLLIAEKGNNSKMVTFIDARFASKETEYSLSMDDMIEMGENLVNRQFKITESGRMVLLSGPFGTILDNVALNEMIRNNGILAKTGLRKMVDVPNSNLNVHNLVPQIYVIERPVSEIESIPLDSICQMITRKVKSLDFDLPLDTPWIKEHNLSSLYQGALDIFSLEIADCPNNPPHTSDYEFDKDGKFIEDDFHYLLGWGTPKSMRVAQYRACTYLDGKQDAVIMKQGKNGLETALCLSMGKPAVVGDWSNGSYNVFCPLNSVDGLTLLALLRLPIVYRQIQAYETFGLQNHLTDILVPWNELIINDEKGKLLVEENAFKSQKEKFDEMRTEYVNEVRMRKHDIRPYLRQLASVERLMSHYIANADDTDGLKENMQSLLERYRVALPNVSNIIDHLADEEKFGEPEILNLDKLLTDIEANHDESEGFTIEYDCDKESFRKGGFTLPNVLEQWEKSEKRGMDFAKFVREKSNENLSLFVNIAPEDFQRLVDNIVENARKHGFTDDSHQDYYIGIDLAYSSEKNMYQIDFSNNGTPMADGVTKTRYGIKGEKAGKNAGTGAGGYIVKSIVNHYGGDYDVICKDGITTIRIFLPIATI